MTITTQFPAGALAFNNDAAVTTTGASSTAPTSFNFHTTIADLRGANGDDSGWHLEASSAGLTLGGSGTGTHIPLTVGSTGSTVSCTPASDGICPTVDPTFTPQTLNTNGTTAASFLSATYATDTSAIRATFTINTVGSYDFSTGAHPAGVWSGTIDIALFNAP
ncbi:MAG TPA: hypothetical protein VL485_05580 [Ktedonobacteraceae bacterium]|nr:hypothetical protein [Ktedonobacteraceae bacterium]